MPVEFCVHRGPPRAIVQRILVPGILSWTALLRSRLFIVAQGAG